MSSILAPMKAALPDHTQLPEKDDVPARNTVEPWQSALLNESIDPVLRKQYPSGDYLIGQDCGIYWKYTDPPSLGCKAPDWYLVLGVPRLLDGLMRRSYVLWQELISPFILLEYASDGGDEERDTTPQRGKFWVYERRIRPPYYGIFLPDQGAIEMYHLIEDHFERMLPNAHGRYPLTSLGVELGIWQGKFAEYDISWMRWWDTQGNLLLTGAERALQSEEKALRSEEKALRLAEKLKALGIDPDAV